MQARLLFYLSLVLLSGCITYSAVGPGQIEYGDLRVQTDAAWNQAPKEASVLSRADSRNLTRNGLLLDRISIIPAVPSGEPIFRQLSKSQALPIFKADMLPNEIEELAESSIVKLFGEGRGAVETTNLRPQRFGEHRGMMFDLEVRVSEGPDYRGTAGAMIVEEKLYMIFYLGAEPYYYQRHLDEALNIIESARVVASVN